VAFFRLDPAWVQSYRDGGLQPTLGPLKDF
jgi:hypothetical protein